MEHREHTEQSVTVAWWRAQYPQFAGLLFASGNGLHLAGTPKQRAIKWRLFEKSGGRPGVADLFLAMPRQGYHGFFVEMKAAKGAHVRKDQRDFLDEMAAQGYMTCICYGADHAISAIKDYMSRD